MKEKSTIVFLTAVFAVIFFASAIVDAGPITVDGVNSDAGYGPALAVQAVGTDFGNNNDPSADFANGSELDAAYGFMGAGTLSLALTGNLQTNFNKLEIFFDVRPGGQNQLRGDNPNVDFNGLNRMGNDGSGNGLMFDNGFEADYWVSYTGGVPASEGSSVEHYLNASELLSGGGGSGGFVGGGVKASNDPITNVGPRGVGSLSATSNQSNILGVGSFGNANDSPPASVTTGFELDISLAELNWDGVTPIKVVAFVNGGGHNFASNQFLGALAAGTANLGEPRTVNLKNQTGEQCFTVPIPEPTSLALLAVAGLVLIRRRG